MTESTYDDKVGVAIGRWQVPYLHKGHKAYLDTIHKLHKEVLILVGVASVPPSKKNPLDFISRKVMLRKEYPTAKIRPVIDMHNEEKWSHEVDKLIQEAYCDSSQKFVLYGGRDSFIKQYKGKHTTCDLGELSVKKDSGTRIRSIAANTVIDSENFRVGWIAGVHKRFPISYQTVDIAIVDSNQVLLGRKEHEDKFRFPGGFVDVEDETLEQAALREAKEEVGNLHLDIPQYIGSFRMNDKRYRNEEDKIMSSFFYLLYHNGKPEAGDDLYEVKWFNIEKLAKNKANIEPVHHKLVDKLCIHWYTINKPNKIINNSL